ncbi:hypothetical protein ALO54_102461 [Pseudomonas syringae pv. philadelphi]|nr:Unknown protein sequence [Pseudomonas syringae pv. maculicola]KPY22167.1 hypothetical protein ALO54_102461 [Pseudomonas syringae pv. philadelphi]RMM21220.1 hypothetical protein ALQ83_102523 [Pseudomonas syringae pv. berberidis]RMQ72732.1 hypothetical protein ALQ00_102482 [Pseudomonas syringae pv. tomato]
MMRYGSLSDAENFPDYFTGFTISDPFEYFHFSRAEFFKRIVRWAEGYNFGQTSVGKSYEF